MLKKELKKVGSKNIHVGTFESMPGVVDHFAGLAYIFGDEDSEFNKVKRIKQKLRRSLLAILAAPVAMLLFISCLLIFLTQTQ
jgi:hypothetical protein